MSDVQIGRAENGRPSVKVDGEEINHLIGTDVVLRYVDDRNLGRWELVVTFPDVAVEVNVEAEVVGFSETCQVCVLRRQVAETRALREDVRAATEAIKDASRSVNKGAAEGRQRWVYGPGSTRPQRRLFEDRDPE